MLGAKPNWAAAGGFAGAARGGGIPECSVAAGGGAIGNPGSAKCEDSARAEVCGTGVKSCITSGDDTLLCVGGGGQTRLIHFARCSRSFSGGALGN